MKVPYKNIPTYNTLTKTWSKTSFSSQVEFGHTLLNDYFKEPGKYEFDEDTQYIAELGKYWEKNKCYTLLPDGTDDSNKFWKQEEYKSRLGVFIIKEEKKWYFTRDYYFFLNYCPIINKERGQEETMASLRDGQYHMMLYEKIAELFHLHSVELKRRQFLYSFTHVAKSINFLYFENKKTIKWFASDDSYIDDVNGSWKFLNAYINHLNVFTPWYKDFNPSQFPQIQQVTKIKTSKNRWITEGNESTLVAKTLAKDPKKGVGGPAYWIWYEEGGIAPTADETLTFINPALESGLERVGSFCIGGSVGDLAQCKPLKEFLLNPTTHSFLAVPTNLYDETGTERKCGLFIPAQWGMPEATDEWGNSLPEKALELLHKAEFIGFKAGENGRIQDEEPWINLPEKQYIIKKSQNPKNIKEAFAYREESKFPIKRIEKQQSYIKDFPEYAPKYVELWEDDKGKIKYKEVKDKMDVPYPVDPKSKNKEGVVLMWKPPEDKIELFTYFGGVDNIEVGASETSSSLYSIYIVEGTTEEIYYTTEGEQKIRIVGDRIVASWTGRFNNLDDSNRTGEYLIRLYNAFTLCERNKPNFITHMIKAGYRHLLATQGDVPIYKEVSDIMDTSKNSEIGIYMDSTGKKQGIADDYLYQWLVTEVDAIFKKDKNGNSTEEKVKTYYNLNYVYDYNLFEELKNDKENTDRRDAIRLAIMLKTIYGAKGIKRKRVNLENKPDVIKRKISNIINLLGGNNNVNYGSKNKTKSFNLLG